MGIIKAASGSVGGVMADQWLEVYSCESIPKGLLAVRGTKRTGERSSNTKGEENVISDGSTVIVNEGQCALAIEKGQVIGCFDTPGEHTYHSDRTSSVFHKGGLKGILKQSWDRFGYGGIAAVYQVIMYLDMREQLANPFSLKLPLNLTDKNTGLSLDATLKLSGMFSFKIADPVTFYKNICSNSTGSVLTANILPQISTELSAAIRQALGKVFKEGTTAYDIGGSAGDIADAVSQVVSGEWIAQRGFTVVSLGIDDISLTHEDKSLLNSVQLAKALCDPKLAAATLVGATAEAIKSAANNKII